MAAAAAPRVGLVLGGGGVVGGAFHAGVLAALEEATGWDPRTATVVVGTSAGSVTGVALRAGLSAADLHARAAGRPMSAEGAALVGHVDAPAIPALHPTRVRRPSAELAATVARAVARPLRARPWTLLASLLPEGTVSTSVIADGIAPLVRGGWPDDPLWVCAVRQADGRRVVFGRDAEAPQADAVAASCAIPGFFRPVSIDGVAYVDGGLHSPTNADVLRHMANELDLVLVSSPMSLVGRRLGLSTDRPARRWAGALLDAEALVLRRRGLHVLAFQPTPEDAEVMGGNAMDVDRRAAVADHVRASTLRRLERSDTQARLAPLRG